MSILVALGFVLASYLLGSIPTGYWIVRSLKGIDIRTVGSGSTGATNVLRAAGKGAALATLLIDVLKGYLPVALSISLETSRSLTLPVYYPYALPFLVSVAAIVGHSKSCFLGFSGGKSAATGLGTLLGLSPPAAAATLTVWIAVLALFKIVSLASILAAAACPLFMILFGAPPMVLAFSMVAFIYVTIRHKSNMQRLLAGREPRLGDKPKPGEAAGTGNSLDGGKAP